MFKKLVLLLLLTTLAHAESNVLERYLQLGLRQNLALKQKEFSLEKSLAALKQARGMFLPALGIEARYSHAGGGRVFEIPVGDLMNPVYQSLNQIFVLGGMPPRFPENIPNQTFPFFRTEEQDTKVRLIQPLFQPAIYHQYRLKSKIYDLQQVEMEIFKQHLATDIKKAYFNYLKAEQALLIYAKTAELLQENLRVSHRLFENQKATEEVVFQAKAEIASLQQQQLEAQKNCQLAAAYFNLLLNRPLESAIESVSENELAFAAVPNFAAAEAQALKNRLEFRQLDQALAAAKQGVKLTDSAFLPGVTGVLDYGFQGEQYRFKPTDDYWMASVVLQWNLFNGFQDHARHNQARLDVNTLEVQQLELRNKIRLELKDAFDNLQVASQSMVAAEEQVTSARQSFKIVNKKFEAGLAPQIEFFQAQTQLTRAEMNHVITRYDYQIKYAEFARVTGAD
ncbi:TolC family protein [candidate division KSB1 bacterium]|nr:TolC family protein [candidate division KSB1 bacterium]